ncbi:NAD(P)-binding Rossmann-fold containing protein [Glarea lozoyensis ATCC 20868]|uniref:NAD(P)-binding Rossmann-fold containing protein n=1 Tax=Glarea lozoyensis (strain ATCC 20868 / MF5171) TaxID=1116229 RepID=S3CFD0_GLAL2|nr:NAD(P)-binding Rossmann-fold containing protein [Glarea lozoyensis ATCC 20868]EPE25202.1 NAD(P)-binding Rossmann-fold containing protein [Glarea lozoyensis ATCC 20868]
MPTFAILGATGLTGQQLVHTLLQNPENKLNLYVRSRSKLTKLFPNITENKQVRIFQGSMNDIKLVSACLDSTKVVFSVLASNDSRPGMTIARDAAATILSALRNLKDRDSSAKLPRVVVLSSASMNPLLYANEPWLVHLVVFNAFWHMYYDLGEAIKLYIKEIEGGNLGIDIRFVEPGALKEGDVSGRVSLARDKVTDVVTYGDLAQAMVQTGEDEKLELRRVGVVVDGKKLGLPPGIALTVLDGLAWSFAPWLMRSFQYLGVI